MRKRLFGLALFLSISLAGCGSLQNSSSESESGSQNNVEQDKIESGSSQTKADEAEHLSAAMAAPVITWDKISDSRYSEDGELLAEFNTDLVRVNGEGYEKVAEAIEEWNPAVTPYLDDMAAEAAELKEEFGSTVSYIDDTDIYLERADSTVISFKTSNYYYSGGAHGMSGYGGDTFDVDEGRRLSIDDLMSNADGFKTFARKYIYDEIQKNYVDEVYPEYESILADMWDENRQWYMDGSGIVIICNPYEIGPYASGVFQFHIPYTELTNYMKSKYMDLSGAGMSELTDYSAVEDQLTEYGYIVKAYSVRRSEDSKSFIIVTTDYASDDYVTHVFDITDGTAVFTDRTETGYCIQQWGINADSLNMEKTIYVLGTYTAETEFVLTDEGKLEEQNEIYEIDSDMQWRGLVLKREIEAVDAGDGSRLVLPEGTALHVTATDDAGKVWFEAEDGTEGILEYENGAGDDSWILYIDGVSEYDYFEDIPYAG